jgi:hypothetical protein
MAMSKLEQKGEQQKSFMQISSLNPLILLSSLRSTRRKPACVAELRKRIIKAKERDKRNCKMQQNAQLCTSKVSDLRRRERVDV